AARARIVRRGAPGTTISQGADGKSSTRETVTRLFVLQAARSVARRSGGGGKTRSPVERRVSCGLQRPQASKVSSAPPRGCVERAPADRAGARAGGASSPVPARSRG